VDDAARRLAVPRAWLAAGGLLLGGAFFLLGLGSSLFATAVGLLYPGFATFCALESAALNNDDAVAFWLAYWVVFAAFSCLTMVSDVFLFWVPLYSTAKIAFLVYLQAPQTRGAESIYRLYVRPQLLALRPMLESQAHGLVAATADLRGAAAEALGSGTTLRTGGQRSGAGAASDHHARMFGEPKAE
jgi:hypothetical protein